MGFEPTPATTSDVSPAQWLRRVLAASLDHRARLRGLAPAQHSSEETSQRWRAVGDTVPI